MKIKIHGYENRQQSMDVNSISPIGKLNPLKTNHAKFEHTSYEDGIFKPSYNQSVETADIPNHSVFESTISQKKPSCITNYTQLRA